MGNRARESADGRGDEGGRRLLAQQDGRVWGRRAATDLCTRSFCHTATLAVNAVPQPVFAPPQVKPRAACACRLADCAHPLALFCPTHPPSKIASHPPFAVDWRGSGAGLQPKLKSPNMRGSAAGTRRKTTTTITPRERERKKGGELPGLPGCRAGSR